jgi:two-component system sensor histidine kinase VicK
VTSASADPQIPSTVRVLLIDRSEDVAVQVLDELQRGGYRTVWERVSGLEPFAYALEKKSWDLVVCSSSSPGEMSDVVTICRRIRPDVLFVAVTDESPAISAVGRTGEHEAWLSCAGLQLLAPLVRRRAETALSRD